MRIFVVYYWDDEIEAEMSMYVARMQASAPRFAALSRVNIHNTRSYPPCHEAVYFILNPEGAPCHGDSGPSILCWDPNMTRNICPVRMISLSVEQVEHVGS